MILAGPGVNILIAFLLFWAVLFSGSLHGAVALGNLDPAVQTLGDHATVGAVLAGRPGAGVLRPGDRIVAVDGRAATIEQTSARISTHRCAGTATAGCRAATPVHLTVARGGRDLTLTLYPRYDAKEKRMLIGFDYRPEAKRFGVLSAAGAAVTEMWHVTTQTITGFGRALTESKVRHQVSSIIGITRAGHETVAAGAGYALVFIGFLSLILAVINLFPFLPLDGGHVLWSLAEKVRGKRISLLAMYRFSSVGIVLLLFLVVNGVSNDIRPAGGLTTHPALDERAQALRVRGAEQRLHLAAPQQRDVFPAARGAKAPVAAAQCAPGASGLRAAASAARSGTSTRVSARTIRVPRGGSPRRTPRAARAAHARSRSSSTRGRTRRRRTAGPRPHRRGRTAPDSRAAG